MSLQKAEDVNYGAARSLGDFNLKLEDFFFFLCMIGPVMIIFIIIIICHFQLLS